MVPYFLIPVLLAACYSLVVTVCVAGRMDRKTRLRIRLPIIGLSFLAFLSIAQTIWGEWQFSPADLSLATAVIAGAILLAVKPRIQT